MLRGCGVLFVRVLKHLFLGECAFCRKRIGLICDCGED